MEGGTIQQLEQGSVIHIAPDVAHQLQLNGGTFTYFVVKVRNDSPAVPMRK